MEMFGLAVTACYICMILNNDIKEVFAVISGKDEKDMTSREIPYLESIPLEKLKIAYPEAPYYEDEASREYFEKREKSNEKQFSKIFNKNCNCTIIEYYTNMKIKEAKKLMRENTYTIAEISGMLCFNNPHYFSRVFKQKTGMSPSEYKNSVKAD